MPGLGLAPVYLKPPGLVYRMEPVWASPILWAANCWL